MKSNTSPLSTHFLFCMKTTKTNSSLTTHHLQLTTFHSPPTTNHEDVGQMNMYLGYFENEENTEGDNPPIGIVIAKEKDELLVKYAMHNISSQLFISKYQLYLPNKEELKALIEKQFAVENDDKTN